MLPSASALACRREERVQKAFSVDHHEAGDARLSHSAEVPGGAKCDYVRKRVKPCNVKSEDFSFMVTGHRASVCTRVKRTNTCLVYKCV